MLLVAAAALLLLAIGVSWSSHRLLGRFLFELDEGALTQARQTFAQASELKVDQVLASGKRELLHLLRDDKGWLLKSPVEGRADPVAAQRFVTSVLGLRISDFGIGMPRLPERDPELVVNVRGAYGEESVRLWQELGHLYGVLPARDVVIACESQVYQQIFTNAADNLRARILLPMGESTFEELLELVVDPGQGRGERVRLTRESPSTPHGERKTA
jgi:hypothetical protein